MRTVQALSCSLEDQKSATKECICSWVAVRACRQHGNQVLPTEQVYLAGGFANQTSLWGSFRGKMPRSSKLELAGSMPCWPGAGLCSDHLLRVRNDLYKCTSVGHSGLWSLLGHCLLQSITELLLKDVVFSFSQMLLWWKNYIIYCQSTCRHYCRWR